MKVYSFLMIVTLCVAASLAPLSGCKYDVTEPQWDKPLGTSTAATISSIEPAVATAGVNFITINGTNFAGAIDTTVIHTATTDTSIAYNGVYFNTLRAEVIAISSTSIKVRRPNLATDSCTVKVVPNQALVAARFGPYKITSVVERYGAFLENLPLSTVAVDAAENLYVVETGSRTVYKVTPDAQKTVVATAPLAPTDARIGPDGRLYLTAGNRQINAVDVQTGALKLWRNCPSGKIVRFGDFDANRYFYTGGVRTDLVIISPDSTFKNAGVYASAEILAVRVYNGYVYVAAKNPAGQTPSTGIWRHSIAAGGTLGTGELVLNWDGTGTFSTRTIKAISFSVTGIMYIATDSPDPMLGFDLTSHSLDYFYKGIIPSYSKHFCWGGKSYVYMIVGNTSPAQEWTVYRIDMGTTAGPR
jgi:hypothetical protein